jgi:hypothetical protein
VPVATGRSGDHHVLVAEPGPAVQRGQQARGAFWLTSRSGSAWAGSVGLGSACIGIVLSHREQRAERGRSGGLAEREHLPHPGPVGGLGGEPGQRGRGDEQPHTAGVEPGGDIRHAGVGPDRQGGGSGRADRVHRDRETGRVLNEDASCVPVGQAAPAESVRGRADGPAEPRPPGHGAVHGVDDGGLMARLVGQRQNAIGNGADRHARARDERVRLDGYPHADAAFHQNLPGRSAIAGGSQRQVPGPAWPLPPAPAGAHPPLGTSRRILRPAAVRERQLNAMPGGQGST